MKNLIRVENQISLSELLYRWSCKMLGDMVLDFNFVKNIINKGIINRYFEIDWTIENGKKISYGEIAGPIQENEEEKVDFFNLDEIEKFEQENFKNIHTYAIPIRDIMNSMNMNEVQFIDFLNNVSPKERFLTNWDFFDWAIPENQRYKLSSLNQSTLHVSISEWQKFIANNPQFSKDYPIQTVHSTLQNTQQIASLEHELAEKEQKIQELQSTLTASENKNIKLQKEMQELKDSLAPHEDEATFGIPGLLEYFVRKRKEGMTDKEIAQYLITQGLPRNAIGAILRPAVEPIKDYGQWLDKNILKKS